MKFIFSGAEKLIYIVSPTTNFSAEELYSEWKRWFISAVENSRYLDAMNSVGGNSISSSKSIAGYIEMLNGWRIKPYDGNYTLSVDGNLFATGGLNPFIPIDNGSVLLSLETTSNALALSSDVEKIAEAVWKYSQGGWFIDKDNFQMVMLNMDGTELQRFNCFDDNGNPNINTVRKMIPA